MRRKRAPRKSVQQIMHEKVQDNRSRQVQGLLSDLEGQALREYLTKLAPTREKEREAQAR